MMTNRTFSQTPPDKANKLFAELLDTSEGAVKTREQLFSDLKQELELLANVQEQYLFPVMRRHKDTRGLVREALDDNRQTRALLDELENMPRDSEEFTRKVADLRRVFQQHIRDDKKELLPVILKVLSDEEVDAVVEKIEGEIAEVEETKRAEVEQRRATARRERKQVESAQKTAEGLMNTVQAGAEQVQTVARTGWEAMQSGIGRASELTQRSTGQVVQLFDRSTLGTRDLADQVSQNLQAVVQANAVLAQGARDVTFEWFSLGQDRMLKNLDGMNALIRCRSVSELLGVQNSLIRENVEQMLGNSRRIVELSFQAADAVIRTSTVQVERKTERARRAG